jgi:16S rRNA (cytidine1402-2'-O)-methyltransferase
VNGKLYLIPTTLSEASWEAVLPAAVKQAILECKHFIVENERTARRFLKKVERSINIDELRFFLLNKHTSPREHNSFIAPLKSGQNVGLMSEAGCPGIADPGADIVRIAQDGNYTVVPFVGPSSIFLSLMASGMNGQEFTFHGYLPIQKSKRIDAIKDLERKALRDGSTHIFIEAPYRNNHLFDDIIASCAGTTRLCVAVDITSENESIKTKPISRWKSGKPNLHKRPTIFLMSR